MKEKKAGYVIIGCSLGNIRMRLATGCNEY